ncbi:MAG: glycosyltransferase family 39 protein [Anaerolineae bacterium]
MRNIDNASHTRFTRILLGVFLVAASLRLGIALIQKDNYWHVGDIDYFRIAANLIQSGEYALTPGRPTLYRGPTYPMFLALLQAVFGKNTSAFIVSNVFVNTLVVTISYFLATHIFDRRTGITAAALVAFYPYLIWQSGHIIENGLLSLLLLSFVLAILKAEQTKALYWAVLGGLIGGLAILTKSVVIFFIPFVVVWWILSSRPKNKSWLLHLVLLLLVLGLVVLPWAMRNAFVSGSLAITESNAGMNLWKGNNPLTFTIYPQYSLDSLGPYQAAIVPVTISTERERNDWYFGQAVRYILDHPLDFLKGFVRKSLLLYDWELVPRSGEYAVVDPVTGVIVSPGHPRSLAERMLYTIPYLFVFVFALIGLPRAWHMHTKATLLVGLLFISWTLVHATVFTYTRYRMQLEPFLAIWASYGLVHQGCRFLPIQAVSIDVN